MSNGKRPNRIRKSDYCRVLVTETLPYETPIIFSNDGLYERVIGLDSADPLQRELLSALIFNEYKSINSSIPFLYKIRKNSREFRRLALLHPRSQWKIKEFYEKYEHLILHYCAISPASIRAPQKIAGSFFFKNSAENLNQYKNGSISLLPLDSLTKHSPSFFSYRGYDRLYKFFESRDYFELEKQYAFMLTLDVSKCFDSIYTHSMSWALKDKAFTKKHVGVTASFAQKFDELMRHANHGETNRIVIGPEVSRVFAEILFQEIDNRTIIQLKEKFNFEFGKNYCFRRYVDDVFIFSETPEIAQKVYKFYVDTLGSFNLHDNIAKSSSTPRPFVTNKSRLIQMVSLEVNNFIEKFFEVTDNPSVLVPKSIRSVWRLTRSFIENIKTVCFTNQVNYDEVSAYLIAVLTERVKKMVALKKVVTPEVDQGLYRDAIYVLLDVLYFLYGVSPSVGASYKLCTSIILIIRFTKKHFPALESTVSQRIYELTETLLSEGNSGNNDAVDGFLPLEMLNVMLAVRELGGNYLMPEDTAESLFAGGTEHSYFSIVSCLFYVRNDSRYAGLRKKVLDAADVKLSELSDILMNSEKAYLLLDLLSCPHVPDKKKNAWIKKVYKALGLSQPNATKIAAFHHAATSTHIHINWDEGVDLLNALEKKELKQAY